jgi:hypothetical protein
MIVNELLLSIQDRICLSVHIIKLNMIVVALVGYIMTGCISLNIM